MSPKGNCINTLRIDSRQLKYPHGGVGQTKMLVDRSLHNFQLS